MTSLTEPIFWNDWFGGDFYSAAPRHYFSDGHPDKIAMKEKADFSREMRLSDSAHMAFRRSALAEGQCGKKLY